MEKKIKIETAVFFITYVVSVIGFFSVFPYINPIFSIYFAVTILVALYFDYTKKHPIPRWLLNIFSIFFSIFLLFQVSLSDPVTPVVEVLVLLLGIKLLENKKTRDFMQIYLISMFLLAGSALFTIQMSFLLFFISLFFLIVIGIVLLTYYNEDPDLYLDQRTFKKLLIKISLIPVVSVPFTIILFFVLPRTDYPLFSFLNREKGVSTGFSDSVSLGDVSSIQENESVAFRAKMEKINPKYLYWRGTVLNYFDGKVWTRKKIYNDERLSGGIKVIQEIIKEPSPDIYLFGLNIPKKIKNIPSKRYSDYVFVEKHKKFKRISYKVESFIGGTLKTNYVDYIYLQLPEKIKKDKDILSLAKSLKGENLAQTLNNITSFFRKNFRYSLKNLPMKDPLKEFLFNKKTGNCEYFASSAAVILRLNSIPTRLVAGYRGGVYNNLAGYYIVSQKDAHVWLEVFNGKSWITYDPTKAQNQQTVIKSYNNVKLLLDTINYIWINAVINFNFKKQITVINTLKERIKIPNIDTSKIYYIAIFINNLIIFFSIVAYIYFKRNEVRIYLWLFYKKLEKYGYKKKESETLMEFINRIENKDLQKLAFEFAKEIQEVIYKDQKLTKEKRKRIRTFMKNL